MRTTGPGWPKEGTHDEGTRYCHFVVLGFVAAAW
jgi:hypothetical protein